jgi:hypothetical protein
MVLDPRIHHPRGKGFTKLGSVCPPAARQLACADSEQAAAADFPVPGAG